uniref:Uncharacterized protein n=1 Tax=Thermococcus sp. IRI33 TaxID=1197733 RepID=L0B9L8_9EURY|nr:hypothetical protein i33-13 [Thermococcus sp. IRI33]
MWPPDGEYPLPPSINILHMFPGRYRFLSDKYRGLSNINRDLTFS